MTNGQTAFLVRYFPILHFRANSSAKIQVGSLRFYMLPMWCGVDRILSSQVVRSGSQILTASPSQRSVHRAAVTTGRRRRGRRGRKHWRGTGCRPRALRSPLRPFRLCHHRPASYCDRTDTSRDWTQPTAHRHDERWQHIDTAVSDTVCRCSDSTAALNTRLHNCNISSASLLHRLFVSVSCSFSIQRRSVTIITDIFVILTKTQINALLPSGINRSLHSSILHSYVSGKNWRFWEMAFTF